MKDNMELIMMIIYGLSLVACLRIAYYIYKDSWGYYLAGGSTEVVLVIVASFIPIFNTLFAIIIGGAHYIEKLKERET